MKGGGSAGAVGPEHGETMVRQLAAFTVAASWGMLSDAARETLKLRVIDAVGCAIGAPGVPAAEVGGCRGQGDGWAAALHAAGWGTNSS